MHDPFKAWVFGALPQTPANDAARRPAPDAPGRPDLSRDVALLGPAAGWRDWGRSWGPSDAR